MYLRQSGARNRFRINVKDEQDEHARAGVRAFEIKIRSLNLFAPLLTFPHVQLLDNICALNPYLTLNQHNSISACYARVLYPKVNPMGGAITFIEFLSQRSIGSGVRQ